MPDFGHIRGPEHRSVHFVNDVDMKTGFPVFYQETKTLDFTDKMTHIERFTKATSITAEIYHLYIHKKEFKIK